MLFNRSSAPTQRLRFVLAINKCLLIVFNARNQRLLPLYVMVMLKCTRKKILQFQFTIIRPFLVVRWTSVKKRNWNFCHSVLHSSHMFFDGWVRWPRRDWFEVVSQIFLLKFESFRQEKTYDWEFCLVKLFGAQSFMFDFI